MAAVAGFAVLGVAPPIGLWTYAGSAAVTAERGVVPTTVVAAPVAHVVTPVLSARRVPGVVAGADPASTLRQKLAAVPVADTSCLAVAVDGAPVFALRPTLAVVPASNMKLLTAATALDVLSPTYTFTTAALALAPPDETFTVAGDLFLVGGGDPNLSTEAYRNRTVDAAHEGVPYTSLEDLADKVSQNVHAITGAVVGSDARYDNRYVEPTWPTDLDPVSRPGAISALRVDGGVDGKGPLADPPASAAARFTELLRARNVTIGAPARSGPPPDAAAGPLGQVTSRPLSDIVASMLTISDNGVAEMLTKEIGYSVSGAAGTTAAGLDAVRGQLATWRIDDAGVALVDGSGLSSDDHLTCQVLLGVVARAKAGDALLAGLPVAGTSGTLLNNLKGTAAAGQLAAKTGSLRNVRALTGVLPREGHLVEFSYVQNEPNIGVPTNPTAEARWRALVDALVAFPYRPDLGAYEPAAAAAAG